MKNEFHRPPTYEEICQAVQELVKQGLVVDSGRKRWSERTGQYEILWVSTPKGRDKQTSPLASPSSGRRIAILETN
jgi:hypothetical protein